tara:strand:+ start:627 stop:863 length:237 start_codon:yes stop_codon:yes gene_type:complete
MIKYLKSFIWTEQSNSINPNSMSPIPENKFLNFARDKIDDDDDNETHKNIYEFRAWERSIKQKKQLKDYAEWYDYFNH